MIDGHVDVPINEHALMKAVANQPVSVAIDAGSYPFMFYGGGVFDEPCGIVPDHGVLVVGYHRHSSDETHGGGYWIIKNSWGKNWGEHGYIKFRMGMNGGMGQCGIALHASYPTKKYEDVISWPRSAGAAFATT